MLIFVSMFFTEVKGEEVEFKVIFNKQKYDVKFPIKSAVNKLKEHIESLIGK